jgi:hypothetical protein
MRIDPHSVADNARFRYPAKKYVVTVDDINNLFKITALLTSALFPKFNSQKSPEAPSRLKHLEKIKM